MLCVMYGTEEEAWHLERPPAAGWDPGNKYKNTKWYGAPGTLEATIWVLRKGCAPNEVTLDGTFWVFGSDVCANAFRPMCVRLLGKVTDVSESQPMKTLSGMVVTPDGMTTSVIEAVLPRLLQVKALIPSEVSAVGRVREPVQQLVSWKASWPMSVMPLCQAMFVSCEQPRKALLGIWVTAVGIVTRPFESGHSSPTEPPKSCLQLLDADEQSTAGRDGGGDGEATTQVAGTVPTVWPLTGAAFAWTVAPAGTVIVARLVHPLKQFSSIDVTLAGMQMEARFDCPLKA